MDQATLEHARSGHDWALHQIYEQSRARVFRLAVAIIGDAQAAEEIMQDVLYYALTHLARYDPQRAQWPTWLHTITMSRCRNHLRRRRLLDVPLRWAAGLLSARPEPAQVVERRERDDLLRLALLRLSPKLREALALHFLERCSFVEMGEILGCPAKTAQSRVRLGLEQLRRQVEAGGRWEGLQREA